MVKSMLRVLLAASVVLMLGACSSGPKSTAQSFMDHLCKNEATKAKEYATDAAKGMVDMIVQMGGQQCSNVKIVREEVEGNNAKVYFTDGKSDKEQMIQMVKIDGKWKVAMFGK